MSHCKSVERLVELPGDLWLELVVYDRPEFGMDRVLTTATERDVTFYDAAHVTCAGEATLVTEDGEFRETAEEEMSVCELAAF